MSARRIRASGLGSTMRAESDVSFQTEWSLGGGTHSDARCGPCNMTEADCSPDCRPGVQATTTWLFFGFAGAPGVAGNVGEVGESIVPRGSAFVVDVAGTRGPDLRRGRRRRGVSRTSDGDGQRNRRSRATASYRYARFASDAWAARHGPNEKRTRLEWHHVGRSIVCQCALRCAAK